MAIEKREFVDLIEVLEDGQLQVRTAVQFFENGNPVSAKTFTRKVVEPGADVTQEDARVKGIAGAVHTPQAIAQFRARRGR